MSASVNTGGLCGDWDGRASSLDRKRPLRSSTLPSQSPHNTVVSELRDGLQA
ncbi:hypothetical protein BASA_1682 [Bifidobacterium animalis subsp. animalis]|nr:hypothetical protein BASA_1682 [Bifidobacterium animalis subsp. animalis]